MSLPPAGLFRIGKRPGGSPLAGPDGDRHRVLFPEAGGVREDRATAEGPGARATGPPPTTRRPTRRRRRRRPTTIAGKRHLRIDRFRGLWTEGLCGIDGTRRVDVFFWNRWIRRLAEGHGQAPQRLARGGRVVLATTTATTTTTTTRRTRAVARPEPHPLSRRRSGNTLLHPPEADGTQGLRRGIDAVAPGPGDLRRDTERPVQRNHRWRRRKRRRRPAAPVVPVPAVGSGIGEETPGRGPPVHIVFCLPLQHTAGAQRADRSVQRERRLVATIDDVVRRGAVFCHGTRRIGLRPLHRHRDRPREHSLGFRRKRSAPDGRKDVPGGDHHPRLSDAGHSRQGHCHTIPHPSAVEERGDRREGNRKGNNSERGSRRRRRQHSARAPLGGGGRTHVPDGDRRSRRPPQRHRRRRRNHRRRNHRRERCR
mmetsp:Transcript_111286/g.227873  ORF Transcript_111286/g.227873 Transcript_111286/m.227873 type:complete len:425 (+) Transcript_111286:272-1546(+)